MKEGAKRHPPMFYTFDFFTLLDPLSYEHRRDGENPCLVVPILWKHGYSKHSLTALRMKSHFVVWSSNSIWYTCLWTSLTRSHKL